MRVDPRRVYAGSVVLPGNPAFQRPRDRRAVKSRATPPDIRPNPYPFARACGQLVHREDRPELPARPVPRPRVALHLELKPVPRRLGRYGRDQVDGDRGDAFAADPALFVERNPRIRLVVRLAMPVERPAGRAADEPHAGERPHVAARVERLALPPGDVPHDAPLPVSIPVRPDDL